MTVDLRGYVDQKGKAKSTIHDEHFLRTLYDFEGNVHDVVEGICPSFSRVK